MSHESRLKKLEGNLKEEFKIEINIVDEFPDAEEIKKLRAKGRLILVDIDSEVDFDED